MKRVLVAVVTKARPRELERVLGVLVEQANRSSLVDASLAVVDNDPAGTALPVVAGLREAGHPVRYVHQPVPGIAAARNAALDAAQDLDAIVFVDDDDLPQPRWFEELVGLWLRSGSDGVSGPLRSVTDSDDPWVRHGGVFDRRDLATGTVVPGAATNNLLLSVGALRSRGIRFDETLGLVGGEDSLLTRQLSAGGGRILWCDEAEVVSPVAPERQTRRWVTRRLLRSGGSWSQMELRMAHGAVGRGRVRGSLLLRGTTKGLLMAAASGALRLRGSRRRSTERAARAISYLGMTLGAVGWVYREYGRPADGQRPPAGRR